MAFAWEMYVFRITISRRHRDTDSNYVAEAERKESPT